MMIPVHTLRFCRIYTCLRLLRQVVGLTISLDRIERAPRNLSRIPFSPPASGLNPSGVIISGIG